MSFMLEVVKAHLGCTNAQYMRLVVCTRARHLALLLGQLSWSTARSMWCWLE